MWCVQLYVCTDVCVYVCVYRCVCVCHTVKLQALPPADHLSRKGAQQELKNTGEQHGSACSIEQARANNNMPV